MTRNSQTVPRSQRRARTAERILAAARALFAESGYDRTTIRAVATRAEVDPALVMQHFGSKDELFRRAITVSSQEADEGGQEKLVELLLGILGVKMGEVSGTSLALLRSMLTHPEAAEQVKAANTRQLNQISGAIEAEDAELRAALTVSTLLGVTIGRHLLELDVLREADTERIAELMKPCLEALTGRPAQS
ncbi:TetR/AcrR family transcriptional regulator [Streptomyces cacaoi]|uniref:TetR family transcriptional regulator n=1 Tax=Streptomyces cacaoi TaxID=1898 RepID=A0A4Y3QVP6_STRCI|nr:TetR/AcrR family transcriptional regulator [Streptomyces cacaoi]NNG83373.1 TetR family transcriptional regulator [Streptomyces cacaoi]GEB49292.1 TetR family transcriptional regulator [Streptomyces cacaoi]